MNKTNKTCWAYFNSLVAFHPLLGTSYIFNTYFQSKGVNENARRVWFQKLGNHWRNIKLAMYWPEYFRNWTFSVLYLIDFFQNSIGEESQGDHLGIICCRVEKKLLYRWAPLADEKRWSIRNPSKRVHIQPTRRTRRAGGAWFCPETRNFFSFMYDFLLFIGGGRASHKPPFPSPPAPGRKHHFCDIS